MPHKRQWTTIWSRSQRGCGLQTSLFTAHQELTLTLLQADKIRLRFSNFYDEQAVRLHKVVLILNKKQYPLTFDGKKEILLKQETTCLTDELAMPIKKHTSVLLRYELQAHKPCCSGIDLRNDAIVKGRETIAYLFHGIDLYTDAVKGCVIAFGDSIVEQTHWTRVLATALRQQDLLLVNQGISGNRLCKELKEITISKKDALLLPALSLQESDKDPMIFTPIPLTKQCFGKAGKQRFLQEILPTHANAVLLICAIGVNDLYQPGSFCANENELPSLEEMKESYEQLWKKAKEAQLEVLCAGLTSFQKSQGASRKKNDLRITINEWMASKESLAFADFDEILNDEQGALRKEVHLGDHLHPNALGGKKMAEVLYQKIKELKL